MEIIRNYTELLQAQGMFAGCREFLRERKFSVITGKVRVVSSVEMGLW